MHILFAHNDYGKFSGEEHAVRLISNLLNSKGHRVTWLRRSSAELGDSFLRKSGAFFSGIYSFESKRRIARLLKINSIDLVQIQNIYPFLSPSIFLPCKEHEIPVVMRCPNYRLFCPTGLHFTQGRVCDCCLSGKEWHCILQNCAKDYLKSISYGIRSAAARLTGIIKKSVHVFIVLSEFQKKRFVAGGIPADRIAVLPNAASETNGIKSGLGNGDLVGFIGRVSSEKGISHFIEAGRLLPHYPFAAAGRINVAPEIWKNVPSNVELKGFLSGDSLENFYRKIRMLVFPSICFEGFPNAVAQAMMHGKPVVASRIGSLPEIVDDGITGLLFEPGNADDMSEKIQYLWERPGVCREMGRAGLEKARKEYSQDKYYKGLIEIYEKAGQIASG